MYPQAKTPSSEFYQMQSTQKLQRQALRHTLVRILALSRFLQTINSVRRRAQETVKHCRSELR
jgi:hypothetical protein